MYIQTPRIRKKPRFLCKERNKKLVASVNTKPCYKYVFGLLFQNSYVIRLQVFVNDVMATNSTETSSTDWLLQQFFMVTKYHNATLKYIYQTQLIRKHSTFISVAVLHQLLNQLSALLHLRYYISSLSVPTSARQSRCIPKSSYSIAGNVFLHLAIISV